MNIDKVYRRLRGIALAMALAAVALTGGCLAESDRDNADKTVDDTGDGGGDGDGGGGTLYYYDTDIAPVFEAKCAVSGCHSSPPGGSTTLSLTAADYAAIVDQPASGAASGFKFIDTTLGSADSYIYMKVTGDSRISGSQMPYLSNEELVIVAAWIDQDPPAAETAP